MNILLPTKPVILNHYNSYKKESNSSSIATLFFKLWVLTLFLTSVPTIAQETQVNPIYEKTDQLIKENKLSEAFKVINRYAIEYPNDFNAAWKTAQIAYWSGDIQTAKALYEKLIIKNETNYALQYDYAKMLFEIGNYKQAEPLFTKYRSSQPNAEEVWSFSIKNAYFNNDLKKAKQLLNQLPTALQSNPEFIALNTEITALNAINIGLALSYVNDNQPMQTFIPKLRVSKMHNSYLNWFVEGTFNSFSNDTLNASAPTFKLGNKFKFTKLKLETELSLGNTLLPNANESALIGGMTLSKKIVNGVALMAELSRNPYYYSLPSTSNFVLQDNAGVALAMTNIGNFSGNLQYQKQTFNDNNFINASSLWLLSPGFGNPMFKVKVGYAYEAMHADKDNFTAVQSLAEIVENFTPNPFIEGYYQNYFTPQNQKIHSALLSVEFKPNPKLAANFSGSYGFAAQWDNPYLFLNEDNGSLIIDKGFSSETFKPATYKADVDYALNQNWNIGLHYNYFKTAFYTADTFLLNLNYKIISEK